jgi:hypothetical protein
MISEKNKLPNVAIVEIRKDRKIYRVILFNFNPDIILENYIKKRLTN